MRRLVVLGLAFAALAPADAAAVSVHVTDTALVYTAAPGELNRVAVREDRGLFYVLDSSDQFAEGSPAPVTAQDPCWVSNPPSAAARAAFAPRAAHPFPVIVECPARPEVVVVLGDLGDGFSLEPGLTTPVRLEGEAGDDSVSTSAGADLLIGGEGDDHLGGGGGADRLDGGPGADTARYDFEARSAGVTVDLPAGVGGGAADGGRDALVAIEGAIGTQFSDTLIGDGGANDLVGGDGNDRVRGGAGDDLLTGGLAQDLLEGGAGADRLDARDGDADRVRCHGGDDAVSADARDRASADCDAFSVARPSVFGELLTIQRRATLTARGSVRLRLSCTSTVACRGRVVLTTPAGRRLGRRSFSVPAGRNATVAVRPAASVRRRLRRARALPLVARVTSGDGDRRVRTTRRLVAVGA